MCVSERKKESETEKSHCYGYFGVGRVAELKNWRGSGEYLLQKLSR